MSDRPPSQRLPRRTLGWYGVGAAGPAVIFALQGFYLLYFYTDVARIPVATVTAALAVSRVWDVVNDPLVGWVSDRTRSRFGRRRGYIIGGALPLAFTTYLVFAIPTGMTGWTAFLTVVGTYFFWDLALTVVHVPYVALGGELTRDYDERTRVVAFAAAGAIAGYLIAGVGTPVVAGDVDQGYRMVGLVFGAVAGLTVLTTGVRVRERRGPIDVSIPMLGAARSALRNRPFLHLVVALSLIRVAFTVTSATLPFFVVHHLDREEETAGLLIGVLLLSVVLSVPVWRRLSERRNKHLAYAGGLAVTVAGMLLVMAVPEGSVATAVALVVVIGIGNGAHWLLPWAMIPDAVDVSEHPDALGLYFGVYGVAEKVARSLSLVAVSAALGAFGYVAGTEPGTTAQIGIRLLVGPIPAVFVAAAIPVIVRYPLTARAKAPSDASVGA